LLIDHICARLLASMLAFLRKSTKIVVWFAVILLIGVFGLSSISLNKHDQYAGEVFGKKISFQEFRIFETLTRMLPPSPEILEDAQLEKQFTWQQLILAQEAQNQGIPVSDAEVRSRVDLLVNPSETNRLSADEYFQLLKSRRTTPNEFESGVREIIRIQKMISKRFAPEVTDPKTAAPDQKGQTDEKKAAEKAKKKQEEYVSWMNDIFQRSKTIDYSQIAQKNSPSEESK